MANIWFIQVIINVEGLINIYRDGSGKKGGNKEASRQYIK